MEARLDERLARILLNATTQAARELCVLPPLLKEHSSGELSQQLSLETARAIADIHLNIQKPIYDLFPGLKSEFEENVERYGMAC